MVGEAGSNLRLGGDILPTVMTAVRQLEIPNSL